MKARESRLIAERDQKGEVSYPEILSANVVNISQEKASQDEIFIARRAAIEGSVGRMQ